MQLTISKSIKKRITVLLLMAVAVVQIISPIAARCSIYADQLGTNAALGSPLLSDTFDAKDWDRWEMVCFGVFLSNFCTPLIDDYENAFTNSSKGSKGNGLKALVFGTGKDVEGSKVLKTMVDYCVKAQKNTKKQIKIRWKGIAGSESHGVLQDKEGKKIEGEHAQFISLIPFTSTGGFTIDTKMSYNFGDKAEAEVKDDAFDKLTQNLEMDKFQIQDGSNGGISVNYIKGGYVPELYIEVGKKEQVVLDFANGWDIQMVSAFVGKALSNKSAAKKFGEYVDNAEELWLDCFGNICVSNGGKNYVVLPACVNQYITKDKQYNMLNSMILSSNFSSVSNDTITDSLTSGTELGGGVTAASKDELFPKDSILLFQDSDHLVFNSLDGEKLNSKKNAVELDDKNWSDIKGYGSGIASLIQSDLNSDKITYPFKIELSGQLLNKGVDIGGGSNLWDFVTNAVTGGKNTQLAAQAFSEGLAALGNAFPIDTNVPILNYMNTGYTTDGSNETRLFGSNIITATATGSGGPAVAGSTTITSTLGMRRFLNYAGQYVQGGHKIATNNYAVEDPNTVLANIGSATSPSDLWYKTAGAGTGAEDSASGVMKYLFETSSKYGKTDSFSLADYKSIKLSSISSYKGIKNIGGSDMANTAPMRRIVKVYTLNQDIKTAMSVLNIQEGCEFAVWTPYIYITYLKWYGVIGSGESKFNTMIYNTSSDLLNTNGEDLFSGAVMSEEEKKVEVLSNTYLLLAPTAEGREYRAELGQAWIEDIIHTAYEKICYGQSFLKTAANGITSAVSSGFLTMESYADNFMTSWFIDGYTKYIVVILGIFIILAVMAGIIKGKKFAWFIMALILVVNMAMLIPTTGEITPYICNRLVQRMFENNMTYWALTEGIENASREEEMQQAAQNDADNREVARLTRLLSTVQLDRNLMVKNDISKKVVESLGFDMEEIQKTVSARWLLPTLMRQYTASDNSADYVYTSLGDLYDYQSSVYWYYFDSDAKGSGTYLGQNWVKNDDSPKDGVSQSEKKGMYKGYSSLFSSDTKASPRSLTQWNGNSNEEKNSVHTYSWMLPDLKMIDPFDGRDVKKDGVKIFDSIMSDESIDKWKSTTGVNSTDYVACTDKIIDSINNYSLYTTPCYREFGYLWSTESPAHYFYQVLKDTVNIDGFSKNLAGMAAELQGYYDTDEKTGEEKHRSFMRLVKSGSDGDGAIRDFLDLEELFTNVMPYMYTTQIIAGGNSSTNGVLGEAKMPNYAVYKNNYSAWLYRCNWVTKMYDYGMFTDSAKVMTADGKRVEVGSPVLPQSYPADRPMVFSEAQMLENGLSEGDLSYVELKLLNVNKRVERKWTEMLNFVNQPGMTKEVLIRQMAIDAMLIFNEEMAPDNNINSSRALYPTTIDLRSVSFDSVMKLIMVSSTKNSKYITGDTMKEVIADSDIISSLLLLADAWCCNFLLTALRNVVLGVLFFLGLFGLLINLLNDRRAKIRVAGGFAANNVVFMGLTFIYYSVFELMINLSNADSVLTTQSVNVNVGVPTIKLLIILMISAFYLLACGKLIIFVVNHYSDMGFEVYAGIAGMMTERVGGAMGHLGERLGGPLGGMHSILSNGVSGSGRSKKSPYDDERRNSSGAGTGGKGRDGDGNEKGRRRKKKPEDEYESGHTSSTITQEIKETGGDIDAQIEKGKQIEKQEEQKNKTAEKGKR